MAEQGRRRWRVLLALLIVAVAGLGGVVIGAGGLRGDGTAAEGAQPLDKNISPGLTAADPNAVTGRTAQSTLQAGAPEFGQRGSSRAALSQADSQSGVAGTVRGAANSMPPAVPMTAQEAEDEAQEEGDTRPIDTVGLPPPLEPNLNGVAIIHAPIPTGFVISPEDYPGGVMKMVNQSEQECVVTFSGPGVATTTINGAPALAGRAYTIGTGVTISAPKPVSAHVRPGVGVSATSPDGRG